MERTIATIAAVSSIALGGGCFDPDIRAGLSCTEANGFACPPGTSCDRGRGVCVSALAADGGADVQDDSDAAAGGCWSWEPLHVDSCSLPEPVEALSLSSGIHVYDTDTSVLTDPQGKMTMLESTVIDGVRVLSVTDVAIGQDAVLRATGSQPLLIASSGTSIVVGTIDVSSRHGEEIVGAGALEAAACGASAGGEGSSGPVEGFGSGAGGGGFGAPGAPGGGASGQEGVVGGVGGDASGAVASIRGGCPGGKGGEGYLGFGTGGVAAGGGGGGSGGYLGLDAPEVALNAAVLAANGGGGGAGGNEDAGMGQGEDGQPSEVPASGGPGDGEEGRGGSGGAAETPSTPGSPGVNTGGGGGGGGVGYILVRTTALAGAGAVVSPPMSEVQP